MPPTSRSCSLHSGTVTILVTTWDSSTCSCCSRFLNSFIVLETNSNSFQKARFAHSSSSNYLIALVSTKIACRALTTIFLNYCAGMFVVLIWDSNKMFISSLKYLPTFIMVGAYLFFTVTGIVFISSLVITVLKVGDSLVRKELRTRKKIRFQFKSQILSMMIDEIRVYNLAGVHLTTNY